ncbi:MAG TPA: type II secretion system F family protein [Azospirillum sp.]|nr:type II secretion system F family protein [Azospirillum sp.]
MIALTVVQQAVAVAALSVTTILLVLAAVVDRRSDHIRARLAAVARERLQPDATGADPPAEPAHQRAGRRLVAALKTILIRLGSPLSVLPLLDRQQRHDIRRVLVQAGIRSKEASSVYVAVKMLCLLAGAALGYVVVPQDMGSEQILVPLSFAGFGAFLGGLVPELAVRRRAARRKAALNRTLPDALDIMIICANSGYSLDQSIQRVAREMTSSAPDLADEMEVTAQEMQLFSDRREALVNLAERTALPAIRSLTTTLVQAQKYGTPLTQALRTLAKEQRDQRILMLEEKAGRLPALISIPLMLLIMPATLIVVAGPAFIEVVKGLLS